MDGPALVVRQESPFNAETPREALAADLHTPNELFYVRSHLPAPHIAEEEYRLTVEGTQGCLSPPRWKHVCATFMRHLPSREKVCKFDVAAPVAEQKFGARDLRCTIVDGSPEHVLSQSTTEAASAVAGPQKAVFSAGEGLRTVELTMDDVKTRFEPHTVSATLQCAGNRRHELKEVKPIEVLTCFRVSV